MRITNALSLLLAMLILVSIGSFAVAESELESDSIDDQYFWINGKSPEEITGKFIYWGWDEGEFTAIKEGMMQIYPNIEPEFVNVSYADYLMKVTTAIASGAEVPDVLAMDVVYVGKFYDLGILDDLSAEPYNVDPNAIFDFTAAIATDQDGVLRSVPNLAPAGCTFYKRDLAVKYFGTDDPAVIGEKLSTWDKFIETGIELKEKSNGECYMIAGLDSIRQPLIRQVSEPWVDEETGTLHTEEVFADAFDIAQRIHEAGIAGPYDQDTSAWNASIGGDDVFCYVGAMYMENWVIRNNDPDGMGNWAAIRSPGKPYTSGGIYWGVYNNAQNKEAAAAYVKYQTSEFGSMYKYNEQIFYPPVKSVYEKGLLNVPSEFLGGMVPTELYVQIIDDMGSDVPACQVEDGLLNDLFAFYLRAMAAGQGTGEELLTQMTDEIISKIPEYHR